MRSMQAARKRKRIAQSIKRSLWDWQIEGGMKGKAGELRLERDFSSLCCSRAAAAAIASPPTCSFRPWHGPFQCVCWFNLWSLRSSNSPGLFAISDKCVWPSTMGRLKHTHTGTHYFQFQTPVHSSSLVSSSRTEWSKTLRLHGWPQLTKRLTTRWTALPDDEVDKNNLCWCRMNCVCECVCVSVQHAQIRHADKFIGSTNLHLPLSFPLALRFSSRALLKYCLQSAEAFVLTLRNELVKYVSPFKV